MSVLSELRRRWVALVGRHRHESEMEEELRFHIEQDIERRIAAGASLVGSTAVDAQPAARSHTTSIAAPTALRSLRLCAGRIKSG